MNIISKKSSRVLGIASLVMVLAFGFSCKKDSKSSNPSNNSGSTNNPNGGGSLQPLIASADISFPSDGKTFKLKCYKQFNYGEIINYGDTSLHLYFASTSEIDGEPIDGSIAGFMISSENGFHAGDVFDVSNLNEVISASAGHTDYGTFFNFLNTPATGVIKITHLEGSHIKGTFDITVYNEYDEKAIVTNSQFDYNEYGVQ